METAICAEKEMNKYLRKALYSKKLGDMLMRRRQGDNRLGDISQLFYIYPKKPILLLM